MQLENTLIAYVFAARGAKSVLISGCCSTYFSALLHRRDWLILIDTDFAPTGGAHNDKLRYWGSSTIITKSHHPVT